MRFAERRRVVIYLERAVHDELLAEAKRRGLTLCEVVRQRVTPETMPAREPEQRHKPRAQSTLRKIEDIAHETTRRTMPELELPAASTERPAHHPRCACRMCVARAKAER